MTSSGITTFILVYPKHLSHLDNVKICKYIKFKKEGNKYGKSYHFNEMQYGEPAFPLLYIIVKTFQRNETIITLSQEK